MPITLEERRPSLPSVKFDEKGQTMILMLVDAETQTKYVYGTQEPELKTDGTAKQQDRVVGLVMPGTTCLLSNPDAGEEDARQPAVPGTLVQVFYTGHRRMDYWNAKKAHKKDHTAFNVGDILVDQFQDTTRTGQGGVKLSQDKKLHKIGVRLARGDEVAYVAQAEAAYHERRRVNAGIALEGSAPTVDATYADDEEPF